MNRDGFQESLWQEGLPERKLSKGELADMQGTFDVLVIGGGITGLSCALELQKAGKKVLLAEARNIGFGTSGGTTAHINSFFDAPYDEVIKDFGEDNARLLSEAALKTLELIKTNVEAYKINCGFAYKPAYLFSMDEEQDKKLEEIVKSTKKIGQSMEFVNEHPFPFKPVRAARIDNQAQFHPLQYLHAIAAEYKMQGGVIAEQCRVEKINEAEVLEVQTSQGTIWARNAIYATHIPPGVNILHFRCAPYRSYVLALKLKNNAYPDALGYDLYDPYHYYRTQEIDGTKYLIAGGEDHKTGHETDTLQCFRKLQAEVNRHFDVEEIAFQWSSQYFVPVDGLPYIGHLPGNRENIFVATGYNGNGITYGVMSSIILTDLILDGESRYASLFYPSRVKPVAGFKDFVKEAADVVQSFIGDKLSVEKIKTLAELAAGEAKVVNLEGHTLALYKDENHEVHAVHAACTHIKCTVSWNSAEKSWDCPCHGSRFSYDGMMITAPARKDLEKIDVRAKIFPGE